MELPYELPEQLVDAFTRLYKGEEVTDDEFLSLISWADDAEDRIAGALQWDEYWNFYARLNRI